MLSGRWLIAGFIIGSIVSCTPVAAAENAFKIPSSGTDFLDQTPLQIVGYMWGSERDTVTNKNIRVLRYVQLYNNSDKPINLDEWTLSVQALDANESPLCQVGVSCPKVNLPGSKVEGVLIGPKQHLVVDDGTVVEEAWKGIVTDITTGEFQKSKATVQFVLSAVGYQTSTVQVKPDSSYVANSPLDYYGLRSLSTTGSGYVTGFSLTSERPSMLFNDKLYTIPPKPTSTIAEVYANSECTDDDDVMLCGDYIKVKINDTVENIAKYVLRTSNNSTSRTTTNTFYLADSLTMISDGYMTIALNENGTPLDLTNSSGDIWLEDVYGQKYEQTKVHYESFGSAQKGYSWAWDGVIWQWSATPQPYGPNIITMPVEEAVTCPAGKYLNPDTGRCRTIEEAVNALAACAEGQERNPATNRCRAKVTATSASLTPCGEGQERNPATNRCRSIASAVAELIPCNEGYERNPATNRCRKVAGVSTAAANTSQLVESAKGSSWNMWTWALVAVAGTGAIGYGVYEWRHELLGFGQKIAAKFGKK